ncbi:T9SS type A sorting domain-containing protein [Pontimicrobium sp. MEBiC01747]
MKTYKSTIAFTIFFFLIKFQLNAQSSYSYTLRSNESNSYTVSAIPNSNTGTFKTAVQSYGFTIILPKGVKASITSSLGNTASASFFSGEQIKKPQFNGYLISGTLANAIELPAPSSNKATDIVTLQILGEHTKESIYLLENNSKTAIEVIALQSYLTADTINDNTWTFTNVIDSKTSKALEKSSNNFNTKENTKLLELSVYPNPVNDVITIYSPKEKLNKIELYNSNGVLVLTKKDNLETINANKLASGLYFIKLESKNSQKTIKIIKK